MRSCGSLRPRSGQARLSRLLQAVLLTALAGVSAANAQGNVAQLFKEAQARETTLRTEIDTRKAASPAMPLLQRARILISTYEDLAKLFPKSEYADDALWQGGRLAADAFWEFGEAAERVTAVRLLNQLTTQHAATPLARQAAPLLPRLGAAAIVPRPPALPASMPATLPASPVSAPASTPVPAPPAVSAPSPASIASTIKAIRRDMLASALRVTIELDKEASFYEERIEGPPRVFIDLNNTRAIDALKDATLAFPDDVVRQIRIGRQLGTRTRVVLDLEGAGRHSIYPLYNPFRIIVDLERPATAATNPPPKVAVKAAAPAAPPAKAAAPPPAAPKPNLAGGLSLSRQLGLGVARIVIDPGHGGHDPGARTGGITEADLTLDVAIRLEKLLAKEQGVEVMLTRRTNEYVALEERTVIANREQADLFLSIHANASDDARARGVETYFLNFAQTPQAEATAARENAASVRTMSNLSDIVRAITLNNKIDESKDFASRVQAAMVERLRTARRAPRNLGVKQAPFAVLVGATMPSILAEISFMTNRQEQAWLKTQTYRQQIAEALFNGVMRYQRSLKGSQQVVRAD